MGQPSTIEPDVRMIGRGDDWLMPSCVNDSHVKLRGKNKDGYILTYNYKQLIQKSDSSAQLDSKLYAYDGFLLLLHNLSLTLV